MKNKLLLLVAIALISLPIVMISCEEDNPFSCEQLLDDMLDAGIAYSGDPTTARCNYYKDAIKDYIESDCPLASSYQSDYDNLNCN